MRELWYNKCIDAGGTARIDALDWLSRATLDAIGKTGLSHPHPSVTRNRADILLGFDYDFESLNENGGQTELGAAFEKIFRQDNTPQVQIRMLLNDQFPMLRRLFVSIHNCKERQDLLHVF